MPNLMQLRMAASEVFDRVLRAIDPLAPMRAALRLNESRLSVGNISVDVANRNIYSIAVGKAAVKMAAALDQLLDHKLRRGVIASNQPAFTQPSARWQVFCGGHPEPNEQSLAAAQAAFDLLKRANEEHAVVIFLISGGGSAMMEWPSSDDITLADLRTANKTLVTCGASILEINAVRRAFSAVKGGKLAAGAPRCDQITLIVSDVPQGEERNVASGPTLASPENAPDAREVVGRYNLQSQLPPSIIRTIEHAEESRSASEAIREHLVLLDNGDALKAAAEAARERGFIAEVARDISDQPIAEGCDLLLKRFAELRAKHAGNNKVICLISGGEFSCPVRGAGIGGRNLETALRLACSPRLDLSDTVALCAGTDGIDGNSPAAGATVDITTLERANAIGLDARDFIERSDAYSFFIALGDVLATGATGTNVRDIRLLLQNRSR